MGFDIIGIAPVEHIPKPVFDKDFYSMNENEREQYAEAINIYHNENPGAYFRNNCWWWRPLWDYVCAVCKDILDDSDICAGHYNDGHIIDADTVAYMCILLNKEVRENNHVEYEKLYKENLLALPLEDCNLCNATGQRNDEYVKGTCNKCQGKGKVENFQTSYPFSAKNVENFLLFLSESGGIKIL